MKIMVYVLTEIKEDIYTRAEASVIAVKTSKAVAREIMEKKIQADEYGYISKFGVEIHESDSFESCVNTEGYVRYQIEEMETELPPEISMG